MQFYGKITVSRYAEDRWKKPDVTEVFSGKFESKSIQAAKAKLTKIANTTKLFSWVQSWDGETREYTGEDLRWKPWSSSPGTYQQESDGVEVSFSTKMSARESGETLKTGNLQEQRWVQSAEYRVDMNLYWPTPGKETRKGLCQRR